MFNFFSILGVASVINARSTDAWPSIHEWIVCMAGQTVALLMSGDDARSYRSLFVIHHLHSTLPLILILVSRLDSGIQSATEMFEGRGGRGCCT